MIRQVWVKINPRFLCILMESMLERVAAVIAANEGPQNINCSDIAQTAVDINASI